MNYEAIVGNQKSDPFSENVPISKKDECSGLKGDDKVG